MARCPTGAAEDNSEVRDQKSECRSTKERDREIEGERDRVAERPADGLAAGSAAGAVANDEVRTRAGLA